MFWLWLTDLMIMSALADKTANRLIKLLGYG